MSNTNDIQYETFDRNGNHRFTPCGEQEYVGFTSDRKTMIFLLMNWERGPRGGLVSLGWSIWEYTWEEPDEYNEEGCWCGGELMEEGIRYFRTAKYRARKRLRFLEEIREWSEPEAA